MVHLSSSVHPSRLMYSMIIRLVEQEMLNMEVDEVHAIVCHKGCWPNSHPAKARQPVVCPALLT